MNRKRIAAVLAAVMVCSAAAEGASAYTLYSEGKTAAYISDKYSDTMSQLNAELYEAVEHYTPNADKAADDAAASDGENEEIQTSDVQEESEEYDVAGIYTELLDQAQEYHSEAGTTDLAFKLMDYDVALKKLKILINRYGSRKANAEELAKLMLTGECDQKTASAAEEEAESIYFDIKALMFDISVLKTDIEKITGETLKDDFDFDSVYLITDALKIDAAQLTDISQLTSIYVPEGTERAEFASEDVSSQLNDAVQAYYALGSALREYISAAAEEKNGESSRMLGQMTAEELLLLTEAREDKFLAAAQAKADFSKTLFALDEASGNGLTGIILSGEEIKVLRGTLPDGAVGTGLWLVYNTAAGTAFCPAAYPSGTIAIDEDDTARYTYTVKYNGKEIGSAESGRICRISEIEYKDGINSAEVDFYKNGSLVGSYRVSIFTPYGAFVQ